MTREEIERAGFTVLDVYEQGILAFDILSVPFVLNGEPHPILLKFFPDPALNGHQHPMLWRCLEHAGLLLTEHHLETMRVAVAQGDRALVCGTRDGGSTPPRHPKTPEEI